MKNKVYTVLVPALLFCLYLSAQPSKKLVEVIISPDHADWTYSLGERAEFTIQVLKNKVPLSGIKVDYTIGPDAGYRELPFWDEGSLTLKKNTTVRSKKFDKPGFLRCTAKVSVEGREYSSYTTVGFAPERIEPTTTLPKDFEDFWEKGKEELAQIPMRPVMTLMPERCTDQVDVYHVSIDNIEGKIYGILAMPKKEGRYPAILQVPGAGIRPYYGKVSEAAEGFISFSIGIHGIPVNLDQKVYDDLRAGALGNYQVSNLDDKDHMYYRRVYLGCVRAVDFLESLDKFNGEDIGVTGGSQGRGPVHRNGGPRRADRLSGGLLSRPFRHDGLSSRRAGGWPQIFVDEFTDKAEKIEVSKYFDVVNFARFVKAEGWYSWGYNDNVCPPASTYSAYNVIPAKKELHLFQETQHWTFPEQREMRDQWLYAKLKN